MKPKQKVKITIDVLMTALLVVLMAYPMTDQMIHEWTGAGMFLLFIIHHVLNRHWFQSLGGGKYSILRAVQTAAGLYGVYAIWKHQIWLYLSLRSEFLLFDFDEPAALYFLDYFCMMTLFILLSHGAVFLWRNHRKGAAET